MSPALFLKGFENVHKELPREGSQAGLMRVKPIHESQRCLHPTSGNKWKYDPTFKPNLACSYNLVVYDVVGW